MGNVDPQFLITPPATPAVQFTSADTTALKDILLSTGISGGAVNQMTATSSDSAPITAQISLNSGGVVNILGEVLVPAGAGTDGSTPAVDLLDPDSIKLLQNDGSILLGASASIKVNCKIAMTTGVLAVSAVGGNYAAV